LKQTANRPRTMQRRWCETGVACELEA
jgi:hypothetical protein